MDLQYAKSILENKKNQLLINVLLGVIAIILIYYSSVKMLELPLWGFLPLTFFFGCWLLGNVLAGFVYKKAKSTPYWLLSIVSGVSLYLGFPEPSMTPLLFFGFIPLLFIAEQEKDKKGGAWRTFRYSYSAFLLWNILTTFWVANTSFVPSIVAFTLNSLFMTIPFMLYFFFRRRFEMTLSLVAFVAFWISYEMIHLRWEISWPWLTLGNAFSSRSLWIQWYEFTGHLGGSFWVLAVNALLFSVFQKIKDKKELKVSYLLWPVFGIMGPILISFFVFFSHQETGDWANVTIVQPNFEPHYEKFSIPESKQLKRFVKIVNDNISDTTDYVIFPETSFGYFNLDKLENERTIRQLYDILDSFPRASLITGIGSYREFEKLDKSIDHIREMKSSNGTRFLQFHNSAIELRKGQTSVPAHLKGKLVPGAEIFPYSKLLFFFKPLIKMAGGTLGGNGRGEKPTILKQGKAKVAPAICYESIYGYWMRRFIIQDADLIFVVTNDGWWDNTPGHRQHLAFSILRAIEFRRSIARSANTGISCVINQHGQVFNTIPYGQEGAINSKVQMNSEMTIYAKYGDMIGRISWLLSLVFLVFMFRERLTRNKRSESID